jgi:phosphoribosylformylglycinamidine cyclo-ligase
VAEAVIQGIAEGCAQAGCALIGGETAEMPGLYAEGDYDLAGFSVGAVSRSRVISGETMQAGDIVLGLASSGVHSNGYSLVRKIVKDCGLGYESPAPFTDGHGSVSLADALLVPTRIYVRPLLAALKINDSAGSPAIRGLAHITGGGLSENIPRVVPDHLAVRLDVQNWTLPAVFGWLKAAGGLENDDLARTLNCGIGMVAICAPGQADDVRKTLETQGETVSRIGVIEPRPAGGPAIQIDFMDTAWAEKG